MKGERLTTYSDQSKPYNYNPVHITPHLTPYTGHQSLISFFQKGGSHGAILR